jgi:hypothetical protein
MFFNRFTPPHPPQTPPAAGLTHFPRYTPLDHSSHIYYTPTHPLAENETKIFVDLNYNPPDVDDVTPGSIAEDALLVREIVDMIADDAARGGHALVDILD